MAKGFVNPSNYFPEITEDGVKDLYKLVEIVYNSHFSYAYDYKDELYSVGVVKAIDSIKSGSYDATRSSLKNFLYTGMRNEMKNYLHKISRDTPVDDTIISGTNESEGARVDDVVVFNKIVLPRCCEMLKVYETLQFYGFDIGVTPEYHGEVSRWVSLAVYQMLRGN